MNRTIHLSPIADLMDINTDGELVAFNVGSDGLDYFVFALSPLDYRLHRPRGASFAKTVPDQPQSYRVLGIAGPQVKLDIAIANERFNIHNVQPLATGELLLVCCRSHYRGPNESERNGRVYTRDGVLV